MYGIKSFEAFAVGDHASFSKTITEGDVLLFSAVSGDNYPYTSMKATHGKGASDAASLTGS